jgi:hypothetical protein
MPFSAALFCTSDTIPAARPGAWLALGLALAGLLAWPAAAGAAQAEGAAGAGPVPQGVGAGSQGAGPVVQAAPLRYARVGAQPQPLLNLPDRKANELLQLAPGGLVAIHGEQSGWLKADVPGGFPVWVFGRFLRPTDQPNVMEVTRDNVNMRPLPSSEVNSFPLAQKLKLGDRLAVIGRADESLPLADDWVKVWSPAGVFGWIPAEGVLPIERNEDGLELWQRAEQGATLRPAPVPAVDRGPAGQGGSGTQPASLSRVKPPALIALDEARALLSAERAKDLPDFESVRRALERARGLEPDLLTEAEIQKEFEMVEAFEKLHRTEALLEETRLQRQQELLRARERQWDELVSRDPLYARFSLRGRLERTQNADGSRQYRLRRGTAAAADILCPDGRYDLELFVGCELGVVGDRQDGTEVDPDASALPLLLSVRRLEVLATPRGG